MKKYNYIISALMIALGGYIFLETGTYEIGTSAQKNPALWPRFLAVALIVLAVALIIETIFSKDPEMDRKDVIDWKSTGMKKVYLLFALMVGYVIVMNVFGMLIALLIMIPIVEWLMGCRNKIMLIALPVGLVVFCYIFFGVIMKITLPQPFWA